MEVENIQQWTYKINKSQNINFFIVYFFYAVFAADILSMSISNFFGLYTQQLPILFIVLFFICLFLFSKLKLPIPNLSYKQLVLILLIALILSIPRLPYILEPFFGVSFYPVCWDDFWHIQEFSSIVHSYRFPLLSTFNNSYIFSDYYATWIIGGVLSIIKILSIKQSIFAVWFIYDFAFVYAIFFAAEVLYKTNRHKHLFVFVAIFFGGMTFPMAVIDILKLVNYHNIFLLPYSEWWMVYYGYSIQFSPFFTLALWVVHHISSAVSIMFALYILSIYKGHKTFLTVLLSGILFAFAGFSSVFVAVGSIFLIIGLLLIKSIPFKATIYSIVIAIIIALPNFFLYFHKTGVGITFFPISNYWKQHILSGFIVFLILIFINFAPIIVSILLTKLSKKQFIIFVFSFLFIISTFFISITTNYSLRSAILPVFTLIYLSIPKLSELIEKNSNKKILLSLVFIVWFSGWYNYFSFISNGLLEYESSFTKFNKMAFESNRKNLMITNKEFIDISEMQNHGYGWYILENFKLYNKTPLIEPDVQLMTTFNAYYSYPFVIHHKIDAQSN